MGTLAAVLVQTLGPILLPLFSDLLKTGEDDLVSWLHGATTKEVLNRGLPALGLAMLPDPATLGPLLAAADNAYVDALDHVISMELARRYPGPG